VTDNLEQVVHDYSHAEGVCSVMVWPGVCIPRKRWTYAWKPPKDLLGCRADALDRVRTLGALLSSDDFRDESRGSGEASSVMAVAMRVGADGAA
jgi:hypothetical protein